MRAALYLRVSTTDRQTTENQSPVLAKVAEHRGWKIVETYEDFGISGAKGRDKRPAFDQMLKDAIRRKFDVTMCWSIDRLGRSVICMSPMDWRSWMPLEWRSILISRLSTVPSRLARR